MRRKQLSEIKFGDRVINVMSGITTYDQVVKSTGLDSKQVQKALSDLCKAGYICKLDKGYEIVYSATTGVQDGPQTTT